MIFRKIIAVIGAVLTFILLLYLLGFIVFTFFPDYENNFFISLILILLFSFIIRRAYRLIANSSQNNFESNSESTNNELKSDENYEYLPNRVNKSGFPFKKKNQDIHDEINNEKK